MVGLKSIIQKNNLKIRSEIGENTMPLSRYALARPIRFETCKQKNIN